MKSLLVGAGAVGQCFGWHLQRGGSQVGFLVKPRHAEAAEGGYTVHVLGGKHRGTHRFEGFSVFTDPAEAAAEPWDAIWLCVDVTALRGGWLEVLTAGAGDAAVVSIQPGLGDQAWLRDLVGESLVTGMFSAISYPAPLPGEDRRPGMAWWCPPMAPFVFGGRRAPPVVAALRDGGVAARVGRDVA
ncbi:MAG: ketopantoate reductase, partial [Myxococcales bacterium]|nr:ketopantoate reductase [Myxococcales bacterium]